MPTTYNVLGSQNIAGSNQQDRFYAFTYDADFDHVRADAVIALLDWTTAIRTSPTSFLTISRSNIQISSDFYAGNEKNDFIYGSNFNDAILFNNGVISGGIGSFSSIEQIELGAGDDFVDLTAHGNGGVDYARNIIIHGDDGSDVIIGGAGMDTLYGGSGNDLIFGWRGADTIYGGAGDDTLYGDDLGFNGIAGDDILYGQAGNDMMYGGARTDRLEGGDGNDTLYGGAGGDNLLGGADNDILYGDDAGVSGNDKLDGESGDDQVFGGAGNDEARGGTGNDLVDGGDGDDFVDGDGGIDILIGGAGSDILNGGTEVDTAVYSGNAGDYSIVLNADGSFTITDLRAGSPDGTDTVRNVEFFKFGDGTVPAGAINEPPVITSDGGGVSASLTIAESQTAVTTIAATDPDNGQVITYSIAGGTDAALFTIDPATGVLAFITSPDFEAPADVGGDNVYDVIVRASDNYGAFDQQSLSISVTDAADGSAPIITSNGGGATAAVGISENATLVTTVQASDADGTSPTFSIAGGADAALFTIDPLTGVLSFVSAPDFEAPGDLDGNNIYDVIVQASDGSNVDSQQIAVMIGNINDNVPVITSNGAGTTASVNVSENATAVTTVAAVDADNGALSYSIVGGADAALFAIDPQTGVLSFLTAPDFELPGDFNADNVYDVTVQASDGTNADQQQISVNVGNTNDNAPAITSGGGGSSASFAVAENILAVTTVLASDLDGSTITYSIVGGADAGFFTINPVTGALSFNGARDFEAPMDAGLDNIYNVIVRASDGVAFDDQAMAITVTDVNEGGRTITGTSGNNTITPTAINTALRPTAGNDIIHALAGDDIIDGGLGADRMEGGVGNDIYFVDQFSDDGNSSNDDLVIEAAASGTDLVNSSVSYILTPDVENLTLVGMASINGTGNELNNVIRGNDASNILSGGLGNDTLLGFGGNDTLFGSDGNDSLDGGTGADTLEGGAGNDAYFIDTFSIDGISSNDDLVIELAGGGVDTVNSSLSYILTDNVENLTLTGTGAINGTGNDLDNSLRGNSNDNVILGLNGADTINGNNGDDRLFGGEGNDIISGGSNSDTLYGEAGNDTLLGGSEHDDLDGGAGNDTLNGQSGSDVLIGGLGRDLLTGGAGDNDSFVFGLNDSTMSASSCDVINDFETGFDTIRLSFLSGASGNYTETSVASSSYNDALASAQSMASAGSLIAFVAGNTDGWLFWDTDGDGVMDQSIILKGLNSIDSFDYNYIIA
jgi:Ca2+-binding RTX toxin-like protein